MYTEFLHFRKAAFAQWKFTSGQNYFYKIRKINSYCRLQCFAEKSSPFSDVVLKIRTPNSRVWILMQTTWHLFPISSCFPSFPFPLLKLCERKSLLFLYFVWCPSCFSCLFFLSLSFPSVVLFYLSVDSDQIGACPYSAARAESAFGKVQSREASERVRGKGGNRAAKVDVALACSHLYPPTPFHFFCFWFCLSVMHQPRLSFRSHWAHQGLHHSLAAS